MTNKSIKERALKHFPKHSDEEFDTEVMCPNRELYIKAATEQDTISRKEERERCLKIAQDNMCRVCREVHGNLGYCTICTYTECDEPEKLRKAIEGNGK